MNQELREDKFRIKELRKTLESNGNADFQDEFISLHKKHNIPLPKDFEAMYYD